MLTKLKRATRKSCSNQQTPEFNWIFMFVNQLFLYAAWRSVARLCGAAIYLQFIFSYLHRTCDNEQGDPAEPCDSCDLLSFLFTKFKHWCAGRWQLHRSSNIYPNLELHSGTPCKYPQHKLCTQAHCWCGWWVNYSLDQFKNVFHFCCNIRNETSITWL